VDYASAHKANFNDAIREICVHMLSLLLIFNPNSHVLARARTLAQASKVPRSFGLLLAFP